MDKLKEKKQKEFIVFLMRLKKKFKNDKIRLAAQGWNTNWKVLISTILSAQNKDDNTIKISEKLFKKYDSLEKLSLAKNQEILKIIKEINYNRTKTKNIIETSRILVKMFNSKVPNELEKLLSLKGVGIKTANLVLAECFKIPAICVDTHVHRICNVYNFVKTKKREDTLKELEILVPKKYWIDINEYFVRLGQKVSGDKKEKFEFFLNEKDN